MSISKHIRISLGALAALGAILVIPSWARGQAPSGGLTLRALLDTVANGHPAIAAAATRVRAAEGSRRSAGAFANPMLSYQVDRGSSGVGQTAAIDREVMTMLTLPLEPLYQRGPRVRQASALVHAAVADADATRQQVLRDAAHAFYRVARAEAHLDALKDVRAWMDTLAAYNRSRVQEGVTAEADLIRTELERDRATIEVVTAQAELARARAELAAFLGDARARPATIVALPTRPLSIDQLAATSAAPSVRPERRASESRITAADAGISAERTMLFRELGATIGTKQMMGTSSMIVGLSLPFPLFDQNRGEVARASAERDAARQELIGTTRMVESELAGASEAVRILTEQATRLASTSNGDFLARAQQAERIAIGAYREGAVSLLQVIDASRARSDARMAYYDLLSAQHEAVVDLLYASGQDIRAAVARLNPDIR